MTTHPMRQAPRPEFRHAPSTVHDLLAASVRAFGASPAILAPNRQALSYQALWRQIGSAADSLAGFGFGGPSRIAIALPEGPECTVAVVAVCSCATAAPVNIDLDEESLYRLFVGMRIDALIVPEAIDSAAVRAARRARVALVALRPCADAGAFELAAEVTRSAVRPERPGLDDVALLMHTSGTTSAPKIVPITQRRLADAARARSELGKMTQRDRCLLVMPLYNNAAIRRCVLPPLVAGGSVVCAGPLDPERFVALLADFHPTYYMASTAAQVAVVEALERNAGPIDHALRFVLSGGAALPSDVAGRLERALCVPVLRGYGMTETGMVAQVPLPPATAPARSVGIPVNMDVKIVDDAGRALAAGETGEILVRGPEVFDGYENDHEANATAFRDGWFRTGDTGLLDRDGFLFVAGRLKDLINRGGAKVAPGDVEDALAGHPQVIEAAAFALPHPTLGEDVAAAVVLRGPGRTTENELREFVRETLAAFKVPTRIMAVAELPRGSQGKVKRAELARIAGDRLRAEFVPPRDPEEEQIVRTFAAILGLDRIGVLDNFFQLGGDSLRGAGVVARLQSVLGVSVPLEALFREPTAAGLAGAIRAGVSAPIAPSIAPLPRRTRSYDPLTPEPGQTSSG